MVSARYGRGTLRRSILNSAAAIRRGKALVLAALVEGFIQFEKAIWSIGDPPNDAQSQ